MVYSGYIKFSRGIRTPLDTADEACLLGAIHERLTELSHSMRLLIHFGEQIYEKIIYTQWKDYQLLENLYFSFTWIIARSKFYKDSWTTCINSFQTAWHEITFIKLSPSTHPHVSSLRYFISFHISSMISGWYSRHLIVLNAVDHFEWIVISIIGIWTFLSSWCIHHFVEQLYLY